MICVVLNAVFLTLIPWTIKLAIDDLQREVSQEKIIRYALLLFGVAACQALFLFLMRWLMIGVSRLIEYDLRNDFFFNLERLSARFYNDRKTGDLMALATNDLNAVRMALGPGIMYMVNTSFSTIMALSYMLILNAKLTLFSMIPFPFMTFIVYRLIKKIHPRFEAIQVQFGEISSYVQESLSGMRVVKAYTQEENRITGFQEINKEYIRRSLSLVKIQGVMWPLMSFIFGIGTLIVLWIGGGMVIDNQISLGTLAAFMGYLTMLFWPVISIGWVLNLYQRGDASMGRINQIMWESPEIADAPVPLSIGDIQGEIEFRQVSFCYQESAPVLDNIDLKIEKGMTLAVVGRVGCGKSSLVNLIPRLYDITEGELLIDGNPIQQIPLQTLREYIGYVPQDTFLFSDTIEANIAFGASHVDIKSCQNAARVARVHDEIIEFPNQYKTLLGERGINLSGGQKQRIAIARALSRHPKILILDNSLSHVDTRTEEEILVGLRGVMKERTAIIVSNRISTVRHADLIIVLDHGRIVERGRHTTLLEKNRIYANLYQKQLLTEEVANF
ncbi:MAG: hypothetical protein B6244_04785 [Candidatus Cloacimonetes bacterium 4572_55]|nr:MAG: hypothetical protein B6244_04785 [Candidatus Cloacimonetes bacterium 4572_55]